MSQFPIASAPSPRTFWSLKRPLPHHPDSPAMTRVAGLVFLLLLLFCILGSEVVAAMREGDVMNVQHSQKGGYGPGSLRSSQCPHECTRRCSKTQYHKACMFFCQKCCSKCLCVPPGYYGNKQTCACYNNWKTKRGGPKCP
ncbi:gibberellin-regulated protein 4-like isoform X2 [Nymphaea colorata]|uniref:gibberellin-regulated protein 4-like isoform X2 n=1 Tax=Nymphaea colorata TaxID=210225 RepID=UPI00129DABAC|nr:gibberellin-regulated protein 4-like isoform X2 [Nymphaea colorata]